MKRKLASEEINNIYINYEVWSIFPKKIKELLIKRIFKRYKECDAPIGAMSGVEKYPCFIKECPSVWNKYGESTTTFKKWPNTRFRYKPHQIVFFYYFGNPGKLDVQHKCGIPKCIQPSHLMLGTQKDNISRALITRKPDASTKEGLKSWKTWPGDSMIAVYMSQVLGLKQYQIASVIKVCQSRVSKLLNDIFKRGTIFPDKKWGKKYMPPDPNELIMWVRLILIRIKKNPDLRRLFSLKDIQKMFFWTVDFDRSITWYKNFMKKI